MSNEAREQFITELGRNQFPCETSGECGTEKQCLQCVRYGAFAFGMRASDANPPKDTQSRIAELEAENTCDACAGEGKPDCMCSGSGKMSKAAYYLREEFYKYKDGYFLIKEQLKVRDALLEKSLRYLKEGKARYQPNTTNSFVDDLISDISKLQEGR